MKRVLILFALLFFLSSVSAINISIEYPSSVEIEEEFTIKINLTDFPEDNYDVKIDILQDEKRIARILNGGVWKSTFYYVNDIISPGQEEEFNLKIIEGLGNADIIIIKIRDSSPESESFEGYEIEVVESTEEEEEEPPETTINDSEDEEPDEPEENTDSPKVIEYITITSKVVENKTRETIHLNPKDIKSEGNTFNLDKSNFAILGFVGFCILILLLFILKKNKYRKNEFT